MKRNLFFIVLMTLCPYLFSQEWTIQVEIGSMWDFKNVVSVDDGESALCIGSTTNNEGFLVKINDDGEYIDRIVHLPDTMLCYYSAVQLDNGNYMVFGICDDSLCEPLYKKYIRIDVFNNELESISSKTYSVDDETFECFYINSGIPLNSILSPSGTVILAATPAYYTEQEIYRRALQLYELDEEGNILVKKSHRTYYASSVEEITYEPHSDNLLMAVAGGSFPSSTGVPGIYVVDMNLEVVSRKNMNKVQGGYGYQVDPIEEISTDGKWIDGNRLILNTQKSQLNRLTFYYSSLYVIDSALNVYDNLRLPPYDSCTWMPRGTSTAYINDSTIFVITYCAQNLYAGKYQANVILVDKHLNLLGRKAFRYEGTVFWPKQPVAFNDGGCLVPINIRSGDMFMGFLLKFRRDDIEITWDVVRESGTRERLLPYPNPTGGNINIPLPEAVADNARILLFDAGGVKCLDSAVGQEGNLIRLDTGNLASGLYLYRIVAGSRTVAEGKFVKD